MYRPPTSALAPYLYEAWYNDIDYAYALEWFRSHTPVTAGGCSTVRKGNLIGRNLDWTYSESAEFIVHTGNTVGVANAIPTLTDAFVKSGADSELYKIVPFMLSDGINKHGLVVSTLVVPTDKGDNSVVRPMELAFEEVCTLMLPRFVLDRFNNADSACGYLMRSVRLYHPKTLQDQKYDQHFVIADKYDTYCMEFIGGQYVVHDISDKSFVTNFHLSGVIFNADGSVSTPANGKASDNQITDNGSGLERYNLINAQTGDIQTLMKDLAYTRAYQSHSDPAVPRWDTEFVGNGRTVDTPTSEYDSAQATAARMYLDRSRVSGDTWQTVHSAIYDIENKTLRVAAQENFDTQWEVSVMSDQVHVQHLRGNTAKNDAFTGLDGEITVDTQVKTARVHDGVKQGGYELVNTSSAQTITGAKTFTVSPQVPTATTGDSSTKAANTAFVAGAIAAVEDDLVHKTGNEEIAGNKTFTGTTHVSAPLYVDYKAGQWHMRQVSGINVGEIGATAGIGHTECLLQSESNNKEVGRVQVQAFGNEHSNADYRGSTRWTTWVRDAVNEVSGIAEFGIVRNSNTGDYAYCPTPRDRADNTNKIATTEWVNTRILDEFKLFNVKQPLTAPISMFVNGATGSDTLDDGRGMSASKPFKTIQAAINYINITFDLFIYNLTLEVEAGTYNEAISIPTMSSSTGTLYIRGRNGRVTLVNGFSSDNVININNAICRLVNIDVVLRADASTWSRTGASVLLTCITCSGAATNAILDNVTTTIDITGTRASGRAGIARTAVIVQSKASCGISGNFSVSITQNATTGSYTIAIRVYLGGQLTFNRLTPAPAYTVNALDTSAIFASANNGTIRVGSVGDMPTFTGTFAGKKYEAISGGQIDGTGSVDYFPGNTPGTVEAATYSWYK